MSIDRHRLRGAYARLRAMQQTITVHHGLTITLGRDYDKVVDEVREILGEPTDVFKLPPQAFQSFEGSSCCIQDEVLNKLNQLISYLEYTQHVGTEIIQIGSIFNSIQDAQLKSRCADLLSAPGNFDRVINQATQVLKSGATSGLVGAALINQMVKGDSRATVLKFSDDKNEQEGYANILRGIVGAYRNPTHHHVLDHNTREDALKVCAFIDGLLKVVDAAAVNKTSP